MSASVIELEGTLHQRVQKLLPWAVLCRLPETEQRLVNEHATSCAQCRDDLAWQRKLQAVELPAGPAPDMEAALARLAGRLEERPRAANGGWMRWALAAQLLLIAGLGMRLLTPAEPAYRLLGASGGAPANLVVVFKPDTSEAKLRSILQASGASVVGGPTSSSAWLLNVPAPQRDGALTTMRANPAVDMVEVLQAAP